MSRLKDRIFAMIRAGGPITLSTYMNACLHDPKDGYYATRPGLGQDFITAPEISQVFGELLGLWAAHEWQALGAPDRFVLCEVGPGRGTLISDALRATRRVPGFHKAMQLHLVEPSPALQSQIKQHLTGTPAPTFLTDIADIPGDMPLILLANEWLDCLPVRRFVRDGAGPWTETAIAIGPDDSLIFGRSTDSLPDIAALDALPAGTVSAELQPGLETLTAELINRAQTGQVLRALFVDYGPANETPADTLRAYSKGEQIDPLAAPGESDLTVDVDFARLAELARNAGLDVRGPTPQGQVLLALGAEARLNQLAKSAPDQASDLYESVKKLVDPAEMGDRFQVICLSSQGLPLPAGI